MPTVQELNKYTEWVSLIPDGQILKSTYTGSHTARIRNY
jgi:hypothetical protein